MKTNLLPFICAFTITLCCINPTKAQVFTDQLGAINTNFLITSGETEISKSQILLQRAEGRFRIQSVDAGGAGFGYGYQSYHLEFFAEEKIQVVNAYEPLVKLREFYAVKCFDEAGKQIGFYELEKYDVDFSLDKSGGNTSFLSESDAAIYSIDLKDFPLIQLNYTKRIDITLIRLSRKH